MDLSFRHFGKIYLCLLGATFFAYGISEAPSDRRLLVAGVMAVAALKVGLILRHFMELEAAPKAWRIGFACWTWGCAAMIAGMFAAGAT
jgi:hypothetical protein